MTVSCTVAIDRLLPVVNKLHNIFQRCGLADPIDLPQIVVVGSQSSGKSSVLESIVGFDFLPRGTGVVTRSPILIQLNKIRTVDDSQPAQRWVEFLHAPDKRFETEADIQAEIIRETERVAGKNKKLTPTAVIMKVFSTQVVDLTLIDLPGLTKVPVGDQPPDIEKLVRAMIYSYIEKPNTIILAVHPANTDIATSDALQMAGRVDPQGLRTLGVVTKLDLMDAGTNALDMLLGRIIPLRRGYVGVVNRSQADLDTKATVTQARVAEKAFFQSHPVYAPYAAKMGSQYLAELLSAMLMEHIRNVLPSIRTKITTQLSDVREQLASLGPEVCGADDSSGTLLHLLTNYASAFSDAIDGRPKAPIATNELAGGARISFIFHDKFGRQLANMDPFDSLGTEEIRTALRNATGHRTPLFIPESAFELLVKRQINMFLDPSLACVDMVYDELTRLAEVVESPELARFHRLRMEVFDTTLKLLRERKTPTVEMIHNLIEMEMSYINTWHPDFVGGKQALAAIVERAMMSRGSVSGSDGPGYDNILSGKPARYGHREVHQDAWVEKNLLGQQANPAHQNRASSNGIANDNGRGGPEPYLATSRRRARGTASSGRGLQDSFANSDDQTPDHIRVSNMDFLSDEEQQELEILRTLLESYFNIVRKRMQDMVPKAIITFLVQRSKDALQSVLVKKLYRPNIIEKLMVESSETTERRKDMKAVESLLEQALSEVNEIRDVH
ncbi:Dynamin-related protein 3B [Gracilariopsis chorda]|uniref:Dynamin-related protein 3B n=1 Tax=Gracilariopsis chorda TaxID=448386 RepID=A0A2V3IX33_9FLOR|nr:Dynamin-related protein 3B [Gracilariopsis chorda]|eukprot:PXF46671.1 Dynamin-related protein 3B [Gracilariopsis chorda]